MTTYELKRGDTGPSPRAQLLDANGNPVNLTGATVRFKARRHLGAALTVDAAAMVEGPATSGWVHWDPAVTDTEDADVGGHLAEWQVTFSGGAVQTFPGGDAFDILLIGADLDSPVSAAGPGYAPRALARQYGVSGQDAEVDAAIAAAQLRVDDFTGHRWQAAAQTVVAAISGKGVALLPLQIDPAQPVQVRPVGATTDLPATSYQVTSSRTRGQVDAVWLGVGGSDPIIAGAEPWNGGWANLLPRTGQLQVTGTFGTAAVPYEVQLATALVAADLQAAGQAGEQDVRPDTDDEGNVVRIAAGRPDAPEPGRTTGTPLADQLLRPLRRQAVRLA